MNILHYTNNVPKSFTGANPVVELINFHRGGEYCSLPILYLEVFNTHFALATSPFHAKKILSSGDGVLAFLKQNQWNVLSYSLFYRMTLIKEICSNEIERKEQTEQK